MSHEPLGPTGRGRPTEAGDEDFLEGEDSRRKLKDYRAGMDPGTFEAVKEWRGKEAEWVTGALVHIMGD